MLKVKIYPSLSINRCVNTMLPVLRNTNCSDVTIINVAYVAETSTRSVDVVSIFSYFVQT